jgi:hypothetical protein
MIDNYKYRKVDVSISKEKELLIHDIKVVYSDASDFFEEFFTKLAQETKSAIYLDDNNLDFWRDFIDTDYDEVQTGIIKKLMKDDFAFYSFYSKFPRILEMAISIDNRFTWDVLSDWLANAASWVLDSNQIFWDILCSVLERNKDSLDIQKITKRVDLEVINGISLTDQQIALLQECGFFNLCVLSSGRYIFDVDYDSILSNNGHRELAVLPWFNHVQWDKTLMEKLNRAMYELDTNIRKMSGKHYGSMERSRRNHFETIINSNKEMILKSSESLEAFENIKSALEGGVCQ